MSNIKNSISVKEWREYRIDELFDIERGKRLKSEDREKGEIRYFSASESNNGLTDLISNPIFVRSNKIIFSTFGDAFYIDGEFTASDEISILSIKETYHIVLNKEIGLFLCTVLNKMKIKFMFGRKAFKNKYEKECIKLPSKNGKPDWEYMEKYMKRIDEDYITKIEELKKSKTNQKIHLKPLEEWQEYKVGELFEIKRGKNYPKEKWIEGNVPIVTTKEGNNGVEGYIESDELKTLAKCITIAGTGSVGSCFWQENDFVLGEWVLALLNDNLNKFNAIFILTLLTKEKSKYYYGRKLSNERLSKTILKLPTKNNEPDWEYMESYIKSLPYSYKI